MDSYTHRVTVRMYEGSWCVLSTHAPGKTAAELAEQWARQLHADVAVWGTAVVSDDPDVIAPGDAVVIPARSIVSLHMRDLVDPLASQPAASIEPAGFDPDMADLAAVPGDAT